jgi:hypothetical protein
VVQAAGTSSLNQTAYAIAYNDLLAIFVPFLLSDSSPDRGWALESVWGRYMHDNPRPTLGSWRKGIEEGWRPTQIFNATIAETGERLLLSSIDCPTIACSQGDARWRARSFADLHANGDLDVVTAARLSATFPWVTPLARQPGPSSAYHIADGGYYDNFGVITALEWLSRVHAQVPLSGIADKVILLQIRAASSCVPKPRKNSGWLYATLGPLVTMLNVRDTSQRNSNEAAIITMKAFLAQAQERVALETVSFELDEDSPLSWHLSGTERERVKRAWDKPVIQQARTKLACLWRTPAEAWARECPDTSLPTDLSRRDAAAVVFQSAHQAAERSVAESLGQRECAD